jgi:hypothetical protein
MLNFMPLVQPSFLRGVFGMPARFRRNAAFHIQAIRTLNPSLARFPLSKGGVLYPFGVSNTLSWLITNAKIRLAAERPDCKTDRLFARLRDYVGDLAHSAEVRENPMYDHGKIVEAIRRYYGGDLAQRDTVDWWLTFELWRRSLLTTESPASLGLSRACAATGSP